MAEAVKKEKEAVKKEEPKKQGFLSKLKEGLDDKEEQMMILSTFLRLGILIWSGAILTLAYVELPSALKCLNRIWIQLSSLQYSQAF